MMRKLKTVLTRKTTSNRLGNDYIAIDLPYARTKFFSLVMESVRNDGLPTGWDWQYALVNKITGVVEIRVPSLAVGIVVMQNSQQMLDKVFDGSVNGYVKDGQKSDVVPGAEF